MTATSNIKVYSDAEIEAKLSGDLAPWRFDAGSIRRTIKTGGWKGTLMIVNTIGHLAEAGWHHPDLAVSYAKVVVKLKTHEPAGITDKDFAMARKIEAVVMWQPGKEDGCLEGTPTDPANAYVIYD